MNRRSSLTLIMSTALSVALCVLTVCPAIAHHNPNAPFVGVAVAPLRFFPEDALLESEGDPEPLFADGLQRDVIVGYTFSDDELEVHPWIKSSPFLAVINKTIPNGHDIYAYNGSHVDMTAVMNASFIRAFDSAKVDLLLGEYNVRLEGKSDLTANRVAFTSFSALGNSTAQVNNSSGQVQAFGDGVITVTDHLGLGSAAAVGNATINIRSSQFNGLLTNQRGAIEMTEGTSGPVQALHASHISLTNVDVSGGLVAGEVSPQALGVGLITMTGGNLSGDVSASDFSGIILESVGGTIGNVFVQDNAAFEFNGSGGAATISGNLRASGSSRTNLSQVEIAGQLQTEGDAQLTISGTTVNSRVNAFGGMFTMSGPSIIGDGVDGVFAGLGATVDLNGGVVLGRVRIVGTGVLQTVLNMTAADTGAIEVIGGRANIIGGTVGGDLTTSFGGKTDFSGSRVNGNLVGLISSITNMRGGHVDGFPSFHGDAVFNWSGGTFGLGNGLPQGVAALAAAGGGAGGPLDPLGLTAFDSSTINIIGFDLESVLVNPNFDGLFSKYQLIGRLADGTEITGAMIFIQNETGASFRLFEAVPEPSTCLLLLFAAAAFSLRRAHP